MKCFPSQSVSSIRVNHTCLSPSEFTLHLLIPHFSKYGLGTSSLGITGSWLQMQTFGPHSDLLSQKLHLTRSWLFMCMLKPEEHWPKPILFMQLSHGLCSASISTSLSQAGQYDPDDKYKFSLLSLSPWLPLLPEAFSPFVFFCQGQFCNPTLFLTRVYQ